MTKVLFAILLLFTCGGCTISLTLQSDAPTISFQDKGWCSWQQSAMRKTKVKNKRTKDCLYAVNF